MTVKNLIRQYSSFNPPVIIGSLLIVSAIFIAATFFPHDTLTALNASKQAVFSHFSWFYILSVAVFFVFMLFLALGRLGDIKLGTDEEEPEFKFSTWLAMLFAAGMGVGLMFFGVAEPLSHFLSPIIDGSGEQLAKEALLQTSFHWGIHAWTIYAVVALALAYFGFRYKLPLSLRSCFYPLLKEKINGPLGHGIDIVALCVTIFGIITTLGFGAVQLTAGLEKVGILNNSGSLMQSLIIVAVMSIAVISAASGVGKGVKILSEINIGLAVALLIFVSVTGPTLYLLSAYPENLGYYFSRLIEVSFRTFAYDTEHTGWFSGWTVLYWAWWLSWSPFVGLFIARISRGRTIREFIFGVLVLPTLFNILWFTVFGNSAIWLNEHVANGALGALVSAPEKLLFEFLDYLPLSTVTGIVALLVLALFFITSADSGIYVLNNISAEDKSVSAPRWQVFMWGIVLSVVAISLLNTGTEGLSTLQAVTLMVALPFAFLMILMCYSLWQALLVDNKYFNTKLTATSVFWTGDNWQERLSQILNQTQEEDVLKFFKKVGLPAMYRLQNELVEEHGLTAYVNKLLDTEQPAIELVIEKDKLRNFVYGIRSTSREVGEHLIEDPNLPNIQHKEIVEPLTYFSDGRTGYDVQYMKKDELIADILKQYERYLQLLDEVGQEIMAHEQEELAE
ncbi:choline/glycine/proline betaine transport protein [Cricetibacter osteomyelitidis]|uniref:Choline/glycine/proline betaine transport protein n=1 Tax=Cricetibacter osteomyelitidis TaxID=1521931 RepID=A0A4R2T256_9PAST|nr:BCCT family transporter [Cricetibacter osteomyelitidis]TCP94884.1 choline/glycine/proline betaine transport protein [Cricetibacter osteomyelitidis]